MKAWTAQTFRCVRAHLFENLKNRSNYQQIVQSTKFTFHFPLQNLFKTCFYSEKKIRVAHKMRAETNLVLCSSYVWSTLTNS